MVYYLIFTPKSLIHYELIIVITIAWAWLSEIDKIRGVYFELQEDKYLSVYGFCYKFFNTSNIN